MAIGNMPKEAASGRDPRKSAPQNTAVGSGSRPTAGKTSTPIATPKDAHDLDGRSKTQTPYLK